MSRSYYHAVYLSTFVILISGFSLQSTSALTETTQDQEIRDQKASTPFITDRKYSTSESSLGVYDDFKQNEELNKAIITSPQPFHEENVFKNISSEVESSSEPTKQAETILETEHVSDMNDTDINTRLDTNETYNSNVTDHSQNVNYPEPRNETITHDMAIIQNAFHSDLTNDEIIEARREFDESISSENNTIIENFINIENHSLEDFNKEEIMGDLISDVININHTKEPHSANDFYNKNISNKEARPTYSALTSEIKPNTREELYSKSTKKPNLSYMKNYYNHEEDEVELIDAEPERLPENQSKVTQENKHTSLEKENILSVTEKTVATSINSTISESIEKEHQENLPLPQHLYGSNKNRYGSDQNPLEISREESLRLSNLHYSLPVKDNDDKSKANNVYFDSLLKDYTGFNKEKIEPSVLFEDCADCDIRILPIKPLEQKSTPRAEEESLPSSKISFADLPEGRKLHMNSLGLSDGVFLFRYISEFLSWIQPNDFPVELLKDALKTEMSWISLLTQSLKVEAGFVACLVVGVLLALAVPVVVLSHACYRMGGHTEDQEEAQGGWAGNCRRRTLVFILQLLLVLLCAGMVAMFVTNEQLSSAVVQSSDVMQTALSDVSTFVHNSHLQLHFLLTQSLDQTLQAIFADLDNVDTLLGRPIQTELVRETGLDVALDSLSDMTKEAKKLTQQVDVLMEEVRTTQELLTSSREKLSDLRQQVELFRRACGLRDRPMCDTIDASGLEVTFKLDTIKTDERLNRMRRMGGVGLELAAAEANDHFLTIPSRVEADTRDAREDVRRLLTRQRAEVDDHTLALERLVRELNGKVGEARFQAGYWTQDLDQMEYWRWIVCLGGGAAVLMIWLMLLCSMCCGCCGSEKAAGPTILVTIVLMCLFSTALWTLVMVGLLVGGHAEVFLCRPLYDEPEFHVLSRLVDQPGVFYDRPSGGFIGNVIYGNDTIDVPVKQVLRDCQAGHPVYPALGLHRVMDVTAAVGRGSWADVSSHLHSITANLSHLEVLSPALTDQLGYLLATLSVNFTEHRIQMSRPVTGKDLDSFARQLYNVGNQLKDLATASRMETLTSRIRRLIDSHIRPLEGRKDAVVYQLTALEVQTQPLQRQVNQSLSHLKTIQFFINSKGQEIAQKKSREYVKRLFSYIEQLREHVTRSAEELVAPCTPIWNIFNSSRLFLCHHTVDPLNGFWFATMWCLLVLLVATPVCLKLVDYYRVQGGKSSGSPSENLMSSEQGGAWSTPGYDIKCSKEHNGWSK